LAIVVVVLGILITGIVGGQSIMETAKRQKVITQFKEWKTAISAFYLEYDAMPGDLPDAWEYFDFSEYNSSYGFRNVFGHWRRGDGMVDDVAESSLAFIELVKAEILPSSVARHNGENGLEEFHSKCGLNAPVGPYEGTCWQMINKLHDREQSELNDYIVLGSERLDDNWLSYLEGPSVSSVTAKYIDEKIDDGKARKGNFVAYRPQGMGASWSENIRNQYSVPNHAICSYNDNYSAVQKEPVCYIAFKNNYRY
jgi:hypothetical protein